jgi:hypothetical protein
MHASPRSRGWEGGFQASVEEDSVARSSFRLACIVGLVALAFVAVGAPAASASGSLLGLNNDCGSTSQPFAQFGDDRYYTFGSNGGLENGGNGWSLGGGDVVSGNESFYVHSSSDNHSLKLSPGDSALSPKLCMGTTSTVTRFFVRSDNGGRVRVQVVLRGLLGQVLGIVQISDISADSSWSPGPAILNLDSLLGLLGVSAIQLKFTELSGNAQVDDIYVDPWASRN